MMQLANTGAFFKEIYKTLAKLTIAGVFIGLFKSYDGWVAVVLFVKNTTCVVHHDYNIAIKKLDASHRNDPLWRCWSDSRTLGSAKRILGIPRSSTKTTAMVAICLGTGLLCALLI